MAGQFVWYDLSTIDNASAIRFYGELLGWTTEEWTGGAMPYVLWKAGDTQFGGIMPLADEAKAMGTPPNWMGYVSVDDVDRAVEKSKANGGTTYLPGTDIPGTGRFAVVADPAGGVIALFKSASGGDSAKLPVAWCELASTDPDASFRWLQAMFGWKKTDSMEMPGGGTYHMLAGAGDAFAGLSPSAMGMTAWAFYFACMDCRGTHAKALTLGARELYAPMQVPGGGWASLLTDPQGAAFGLFSME